MIKNKRIIKWDKKDWINFFLGFTTGCISSGLSAFIIFIVKYITNNGQEGHISNINNIGYSILLMIGVGLFSLIFAFISKIYLSKLSATKIAQIRNIIFDKTQDLSPQDLQEYSPNSLMTRLSLDIFNYSMYYNWFLINVIPSLIRWIIFSIMIAIVNYIICLLIIFLSIVLFIVAILFARKSSYYYEKSINNVDKINKIIEENVVGSRVVRSFNLFERQIRRFSIVNEKIYKNSSKAEIKTFLSFPFSLAFINACAIIVVLFASIVNWENINFLGSKISIGDILAIVSYSYLVLWSVYDATFLYIFYTRSLVSRERIIEIQKLQTHNVNYEGKTFVHGDIEFRNVSFKYFKNSNDYVLKNISFKIPKNSKFGIVGQTGSGKTTLLNLITRMWDISEGEILINGINIKDLKTSSLLENLSYAFQDKKMLFSGTIEDNVKFSNSNIDESRINKAIKIAQLEDFVSSHPQGIKYQLEEFGQNLSGGQKQRINIARAIAREAYIYLFDDVTSALDNLTEKKLLEELNENIQNSSIIMSSQKISSVENMDQIIVLDKGNISSIGTHEELLKKDKIYQEIYNLQNRKEY